MRTSLKILTILLSTYVGTVGSFAQDTYRFNVVSEGDWDNPNNWSPSTDALPDADDIAIIESDHTCNVEDDNQAALSIDVESDAILNIIGRTLELGHASDPESSTVDGVVEFSVANSTVPILEIQAGSVALFGSGTIRGVGEIRRPSTDGLLDVLDAMTFEGSLTFLVSLSVDLFATATFNIDTGDTMTFGFASAPDPYITITSATDNMDFNVSGGLLRFRRTTLNGLEMDFNMTGGEIELLTGLFASATDIDILMTGGTLDIDVNFGAKDLSYVNGTIQLLSGKSATFDP